jgi:hypothetical protein
MPASKIYRSIMTTFNVQNFEANKLSAEAHLNRIVADFRTSVDYLAVNTDLPYLTKNHMARFVESSDKSQAAARLLGEMRLIGNQPLFSDEVTLLESGFNHLLNMLIVEGASSHAIGVVVTTLEMFRAA